jgi:glycosyltransferase involved in cell wall biosynthesis
MGTAAGQHNSSRVEARDRVFLDTTFLQYGDDLRGIPQVILQLVRLFLQDARFRNVHFIATPKVQRSTLSRMGVPPERIVSVGLVPLLSRSLRFHGLLADWRYRLVKRDASLIIHPEYRTVVDPRLPQVVMYHDFVFLEEDGINRRRSVLHSLLRRLYLRYIRMKVRRSSKAWLKITNSEFTKQALLRLFPEVPEALVTPLHLGVRSTLPHVSGPNRPAIAKPHFLYVGGVLEVRKNVAAMLANFAHIDNDDTGTLHIVGRMGTTEQASLKRILAEHGLDRKAVVHGLLSDEELGRLYECCHFFLQPSLSEGFGLPLIEAMSYGLVACAFRNSCTPEIVGDAAVLAENNDFGTWGNRIAALKADPQEYAKASQRAEVRATCFSEENMFLRYGSYFARVLASLPGTSG